MSKKKSQVDLIKHELNDHHSIPRLLEFSHIATVDY